MKIIDILHRIARGIPKEGSTFENFEEAFIYFGITNQQKIKRYVLMMERLGLITRKDEKGRVRDRWFKGEKIKSEPTGELKRASELVKKKKVESEEDKKAESEVDDLLENLLIN